MGLSCLLYVILSTFCIFSFINMGCGASKFTKLTGIVSRTNSEDTKGRRAGVRTVTIKKRRTRWLHVANEYAELSKRVSRNRDTCISGEDVPLSTLARSSTEPA